MSVFLRTLNQRLLWLCPAVVMISWLAVRTLGASPESSLKARRQPDALLSVSASETAEIRDAALAQMIGRFAAVARAAAQPVR
jgi:hypothetical protein